MKSHVPAFLTRTSMIAFRAALFSSPVLFGLACGSNAGDDVLRVGEVSSEVISKTPVASWSFEECDGTTYSGPGAQNGVGCAYGPRRFTAKFDGVDDQIVMTDSASYRFSAAMTMSAWVRPASTTNTRAIVNKWSTTNAYKLDISGGKYRFSLFLTDGTTQTISATALAAVDAWSHVTATFTGTQMFLYVNGAQVASKSLGSSKTITSSTQPIRIGVEGTTNRFTGRIDEVRLYNAALTAAEVKELAGFTPGASASKTRKVLFAIYNPLLANGQKLTQARGWFDPKDQIQDVITSLNLASGGYANYQLAETDESNTWPKLQDGYAYNDTTYAQCMDDPAHASCHTQSDFDFTKMFNDYGICNKLQSGAVNEVMIFSAPYMQTDEFAFKIPGDKMPYNTPTNVWLYDMRKKNIPDCGKTVFVMGYNYERDLGNAVHSYGHRVESVLGLTVGRGFWDGCIGHNGVPSDFDKYTCIKMNITGTTPVKTPGPGNVHFPPNGLSDYDYGNTTNVTDNSPSWANYPFTTQTTVGENCTAWGCEQNGYMEWWLGKLPNKDGVTSNGNLKNWWKYAIDYDAALVELGVGGGGTDAGTDSGSGGSGGSGGTGGTGGSGGTGGTGGSGGASCAAAYAQGNCLTYVQGTVVSSGSHNWLCSNGNCANCATFTSCAPGGTGCPWGTVWTDQGTCH